MAHESSKNQLLKAAKKLVLSRGYAATTVDAICEEAKLTKGSFYHFFDSKEELGIAVLQWSLGNGAELLGDGGYKLVTDPVERALAYLEHVELSSKVLWKDGCLLGSFALELAESNRKMQKTISGMFAAVAEGMGKELEPLAAATGSMGGGTDLAEQLLVVLEGSIILGKAHGDWTRIPKAIRGFRVQLEGQLAAKV